jgi:hypothetical protein
MVACRSGGEGLRPEGGEMFLDALEASLIRLLTPL